MGTSMTTFKQCVLNGMARIAFSVHRFAIMPWKRTPARWTAIIFNEAGQFAVMMGNGGRNLPSGQIEPDEIIERQCYSGLGLDKSDFVREAPLRLLLIGGRGARGFTFYFSGQLRPEGQSLHRFEQKVVYLSRTELKSLIPADVLEKIS